MTEDQLRHIGPPLDEADLVVVAVHGRDQNADYMVEHFLDRVHATGVAWLLPSAPERSWYPFSMLAPIEQNQPSLDHALAVLDEIAQRCAHLPASRLVWAGFSQGACLVSEWVARHPRRWGGLVSLTGGRIGPPGSDLRIAVGEADSHFDGMPAHFSVGEADEWVPVERVERTAEAFRAAGAAVTIDVFTDHPHAISDAEIARAGAIIRSARG